MPRAAVGCESFCRSGESMAQSGAIETALLPPANPSHRRIGRRHNRPPNVGSVVADRIRIAERVLVALEHRVVRNERSSHGASHTRRAAVELLYVLGHNHEVEPGVAKDYLATRSLRTPRSHVEPLLAALHAVAAVGRVRNLVRIFRPPQVQEPAPQLQESVLLERLPAVMEPSRVPPAAAHPR